MSDHGPQVAQVAPTRTPTPRPADLEPVRDEVADLSDLQERLGNRGTAALIAVGPRTGAGARWARRCASEMEAQVRARLPGVRVHTGGVAAESARAVQALAYTVGHDIVLGRRPASGVAVRPRRADARTRARRRARPCPVAARTASRSSATSTTSPNARPTAERCRSSGRRRAGPLAASRSPRAHAPERGGRPPGTRRCCAGSRNQRAKAPDPEPVIPTPPESRIVHILSGWLGSCLRYHDGKGRRHRDQRPDDAAVPERAAGRGRFGLAPKAFPLEPGIYGSGHVLAGNLRQLLRLYHSDHDEWLPMQRTESRSGVRHADRPAGGRGPGGLCAVPGFRRRVRLGGAAGSSDACGPGQR